ncbi:MAG TPA: winged helix-turn-helix domain-containing protein [Bryobacteraceae bacterium]|nr:winged helix-turn-helix domain-containing protein [Bryobacteraceae bacterium]
MPKETKRIFEFGEFRLDSGERLLLAGDKALSMTPKVFDLLVLMVENPGRLLEKDWILQNLWPDTFVEEANLSVNVSTLRKALGPTGAGYIETVPKRGYRFTAAVREIALAPNERPAVHDTETVIPPAEPDGSVPLPPARRSPPWALIAAALLLIAASIYVFVNVAQSRNIQKVSEVRTIAVLPFRALGKDSGDDYLATGMADALIGKLSMIQKIMVRSTAAVRKYAGTSDPVAAGRELSVDVVLDGSVQRDGKMVRVSIQLLRVKDGSPLWAERFDDSFTNIFQLQDSISEKVARALSMKLTEDEHRQMVKHQTSDTEAYQLYLRASYVAYKRSSDAMPDAAIDLFQQAVAKDPEYALAYAGLANAYLELATMEGHADAVDKARAAALKAVSLDDSLAEAHLAAGGVLLRGEWDWTAAEREFDRALAIDPHSSMAHWSKSILLMALGQSAQSLEEMRTAQQLDPTSQSTQDDLAWALYCNRRWPEAIQASKAAVALAPESFAAHHQLGKAYLQARQFDLARAEFETTIKMHKFKRGLADLGQLQAAMGDIAAARATLAELDRADRVAPTYESAYMHAVLNASLGDNDAAFQALEKACAQKLSRAIWIKVDPDLDPIRGDRRFDALLRRVRLLP